LDITTRILVPRNINELINIEKESFHLNMLIIWSLKRILIQLAMIDV